MSEEDIHKICKICPGEFTGCDMDKPDCWIVEGAFAIDKVEALERRLAEADALCIKLAYQKGGQVDEMRDLKARIRAASELIEKWKKEGGYNGYRTYGSMASVEGHAILQCADELEAALRGEAEGECISKTLMKECGCYPKKEAEG